MRTRIRMGYYPISPRGPKDKFILPVTAWTFPFQGLQESLQKEAHSPIAVLTNTLCGCATILDEKNRAIHPVPVYPGLPSCTLCKRSSLLAEEGTVGWEMVGLIPMRKTAFISHVLHTFSRIIHAALKYFCETLIIQDAKKVENWKGRQFFFIGWVSFFFNIRTELIDVLTTSTAQFLVTWERYGRAPWMNQEGTEKRCRSRKVISWLLEFTLQVGPWNIREEVWWRPETSKDKARLLFL